MALTANSTPLTDQDKKDAVDGMLTAAQITAGATGFGACTPAGLVDENGAPVPGSSSSVLNSSSTFDAIAAKSRLIVDMRFGTSAAGGTHQIKSIADLTANFYYDPLFASDTTTTRMAYHDQFHEFAKFDAADAPSVYVFGANSLTLQPISQHSWNGAPTFVAAGNAPVSGASVLASTLGLASTSGLWLGRVVCSAYGQYAARVTAFTGTNVTLTALNGATGQPLGIGGAYTMVWTAMTALPLASAAAANATSLTLTGAPPASVQNGMVVCPVDAFNYVKRFHYGSRCTVSGSTVTLTAPGLQAAVSSGGCVVFVPYTRTGQLVPKMTWSEPGPGRAVLMELDATWADNGAGVAPRTQYMSTQSEYATAGGVNIPMGGWGSWWLYEQQGVTSVDEGGAEIDMLEQFCSIDFGPGDFSSSWHNNTKLNDQAFNTLLMFGAEGYPTYVKWNGTDHAYFALKTAGPPVIPHQVLQQRIFGNVPSSFKRQLLWERDQVSIYVDGELRVRFRGSWASTRPAQMLINAALGVLSDMSKLQVPWSDAGLANCRVVLRTLKIWEL